MAIGVGLGPIWYILKGERNAIQGIQTQMKKDMQDMRSELHATNSRLNQIVLSGIDEKITVLGRYVDFVKSWPKREDGIEETFKNAIDSIKSDIHACAKYNTSMEQEQRTLLCSILRRIKVVLESNGYHSEAGEIDDIKGALFHP